MPRSMTLDEFEPLLGRIFQVDCDPRTAELTLIDVSPGRQTENDVRPPFSLTFQSPLEILLIAGTYPMRCGDFGPDLIHITPVTPLRGAEPGHHYQAVFN